MPAKTIEATQLLMQWRDQILKDAETCMVEADQQLAEAKQRAEELIKPAKERHHKVKILVRNMRQKAADITTNIDTELEAQVKEQQAVDEAYRVKGNSELAAQYQTSDLMELLNGTDDN